MAKLSTEPRNKPSSSLPMPVRLEEKADLESLGEKVDPTLPANSGLNGGTHPLTNTRKVVSIFRKIGFTVAEATEVETEWFCLMP